MKKRAECDVLTGVNIGSDSPPGLHAVATAHDRGEAWFWLAAPALGRVWVGVSGSVTGPGDEPAALVGAWGWRGAGLRFGARLRTGAWPPSPPAATFARVPAGRAAAAPMSSQGSDTAFLNRVSRALEALANGRLDKVVLARAEDWRPSSGLTAPPPHAVLAALLNEQPSAFVFGVGQGGRSFVGATPELLAHVALGPGGRWVATDALAGTAPLDEPPERLLDSPKDRREHAYVVEAIRAALEPLCVTGSIELPAVPVVETLPHLRHLRTPVRGLLRDGVPARAVVDALHPTPAVCGAPRQAAWAWLEANEGFDRGLYAGPVGFDEGETGLWVVGLRCGTLDASSARLYAGVGLVAGSDPARELAETHLKLRVMRSALAAAQTSEAAHVG